MRKRITTLFMLAAGALMILPGVTRAQEATKHIIPESSIQVANSQWEFGRVAQGASVTHTFWMTNASDSTVTINDVKPGCGCTKAPFEATTLAPGESTHVELIFSTGHYSSHVTKSAHILSTESGHVPSLIFHADVRPAMDSVDIFSVQPYMLDLDKNDNGDTKYDLEYKMALKNLTDEDLSFNLVDQPDGLVDLDFPQGKKLSPGETQNFTARFDKAVASEVFTKSFTIEASDKDHTRITVPILKTMRWGPAKTSQR